MIGNIVIWQKSWYGLVERIFSLCVYHDRGWLETGHKYPDCRVGKDFRALKSGATTQQIFREMIHGPSINQPNYPADWKNRKKCVVTQPYCSILFWRKTQQNWRRMCHGPSLCYRPYTSVIHDSSLMGVVHLRYLKGINFRGYKLSRFREFFGVRESLYPQNLIFEVTREILIKNTKK